MEVYKIKSTAIDGLLRPYATVFFCYSPWVGLWFAILSFCSLRTAFAGLFSLICAWIWGKLLSIKPPGDLHLVNGLLSGLFLSASYPLSLTLFVGLALLTIFVTISVNWLTVYMWYMGRIPLMTFPFVIGTWLVILVFQEANIVSLPPVIFLNEQLPPLLSWKYSDDFFSAVGGLMLVPYPLIGFLMFLGIFVASRYLAFLAVTGYIVGEITLVLLGYEFLGGKSGYNFMLVAMALGGIFMVPSRASFLIAMGGSALSSLFVVALFKILDPLSLPVLIMPFLLSTYFWIGGLGPRINKDKGLLYLDAPVSPEIAWENTRLNKARGINIDSSPIIKLFKGEWLIDYDAEIQSLYFSKNVESMDENLSILSPAEAIVLSTRNNIDSDGNDQWDIALSKGWGSFILMRDRLGQYIFLPKLKPGSILPKPNEWVALAQPIAECGKSKDNSKFCLYLQIQKASMPTSDKIPFHLANVLSYQPNMPRQFHLFYYPVKNDYVSEITKDDAIASFLHLPPGLKRSYRVKDNHNDEYEVNMQIGMTPLGQSRMYARQDCSAAFDLSSTSLVFFDKQGKPDVLIDLFMLALGVTPLTSLAETWTDEPSVLLWPLSRLQRLFLAIVRPLGLGCKSRYTRSWNKDSNTWVQHAVHRAHIMPGITWEATTSAIFDPGKGVSLVQFKMYDKTWEIIREENQA